ncbi:hypothetical protein A374_17124 [Fictibacillus macauensis ZFHKF-1]|uniref:DUF4367 domain-containing protein n=1 Tax=Fictibacillus macauensis ZFHKF-1 TaxID=1196324 RepID=I8UBG0_9BACL|nr:hypothetical protein [Fictibacillus macauensis]EIT84123.1 hypothetical protein A374_17124 [Fictibacillus macauensis ZFHKF-1]
MKRAGVFVAAGLLLLLTACRGTEVADGDMKLDVSYKKGQYPRSYKPISMDEAQDVLPFKPHFPEAIPYAFKTPNVVITDWGQKKKVQVSADYERKTAQDEKGYITYQAFNHKNLVSDMISEKKYNETLELANGATAYYAYYGTYAELFWKIDEEEYDLRHMFATNYNEKQLKSELVKTANSID